MNPQRNHLVRLQWDSKKASSSVAKHRVSFDETTTVLGRER